MVVDDGVLGGAILPWLGGIVPEFLVQHSDEEQEQLGLLLVGLFYLEGVHVHVEVYLAVGGFGIYELENATLLKVL